MAYGSNETCCRGANYGMNSRPVRDFNLVKITKVESNLENQ